MSIPKKTSNSKIAEPKPGQKLKKDEHLYELRSDAVVTLTRLNDIKNVTIRTGSLMGFPGEYVLRINGECIGVLMSEQVGCCFVKKD